MFSSGLLLNSLAAAPPSGPGDTGWVLAGSATDDGSGGEQGSSVWLPTNGGLTVAGDADYHSCIPTARSVSSGLALKGFGFSVPSDPVGILVRFRVKAGAGSTSAEFIFSEVKLIINNVVVGANKAAAIEWTSTFADFEFGGPTDLWTVAPTQAQANDTTKFGANLFIEDAKTGDEEALVSEVYMKLFY